MNRGTNDRIVEIAAGVLANVLYNSPTFIPISFLQSQNFNLCSTIGLINDSLSLYQLFRLLRGLVFNANRETEGEDELTFTERISNLVDILKTGGLEEKIHFILFNGINRQLVQEVVFFLHDLRSGVELNNITTSPKLTLPLLTSITILIQDFSILTEQGIGYFFKLCFTSYILKL